jgi:hypothetical protein
MGAPTSDAQTPHDRVTETQGAMAKQKARDQTSQHATRAISNGPEFGCRRELEQPVDR